MNTPLEPYYTDYLAALRDGSGRMASQVVERALTANVTADELYMRVFQLAQWRALQIANCRTVKGPELTLWHLGAIIEA